MDKLRMTTADGVVQNVEKIARLFPACITETRDERSGRLVRKVDFDKLRQELSTAVVSDREERYQFTWPDKRKAILLANAPINATLRPCREESVNFDTTHNLYIEGDNLDVLKCLKETYLHKVKMIYIDPPYNTGNDFVYEDDFAESADAYRANSGQYDEQGNRLVTNTESNGRFHTDWLNMIYPRLKVARDLLTEDGVIFISINDKESSNLNKMCEEIFGYENFVADLIWANKEGGGSSDSKLFRIKNEHILCYAKEISSTQIKGVPISNAERYKGSDEYYNERGPFYLQKLGMGSIQYSASLDYPIETPDGSHVFPSDNNRGKKACWRWSKDKYETNKAKGFVEIKKDASGIWTVYTKQYMNCDNDGNRIDRTQRPMGIIEEFSSTQASKMLKDMEIPFDYSKPIELVKYLIDRCPEQEFIIADFFSGSATTAHAVMQLNAEDGGNRKFIMVQLPELTDEKSEAYKAGYKTICEIGKERIRRAGKKIKADSPLTTQDLDTGFRVLKLDSTNMQEIYYSPMDTDQRELFNLVDNVKPDRTAEDLLFQVMLELGATLDARIEQLGVRNEELGVTHTIYNVADGYLLACFDKDVTDEVVKTIAKQQPQYAVLRDTSMANDSTATNFEQIFKTYSPTTTTKIL